MGENHRVHLTNTPIHNQLNHQAKAKGSGKDTFFANVFGVGSHVRRNINANDNGINESTIKSSFCLQWFHIKVFVTDSLLDLPVLSSIATELYVDIIVIIQCQSQFPEIHFCVTENYVKYQA